MTYNMYVCMYVCIVCTKWIIEELPPLKMIPALPNVPVTSTTLKIHFGLHGSHPYFSYTNQEVFPLLSKS